MSSEPFVYPPDIMATDDGMHWSEFRKKVSKNCGAYLRSKGAPSMRETMDESIASSVARRRAVQSSRRRDLDSFFDELKTPIEDMKRPRDE